MKSNLSNIIRISILFILLLLPIFYSLAVAVDLEYSLVKKLAYLWVVLILLLFPALFLKARTYFIVQGIFNFLFFPIDVVSLYLNKQSTSQAFLKNIIGTNFKEAAELLISLWPLCLGVVGLYVIYFILAFKVENKNLIPQKLKKVILISGAVAAFIGVTFFTFYSKRKNNAQTISESVGSAINFCYMKLYKIYPYNLYVHLAGIIEDTNRQKNLQKQIANFTFGITPQQSDSAALYILVIGEAVRYDHLGINGYERNTTPLLQKRNNLISYDSAFSQANLTSYSLPLILSRATADDADRAYREKSIAEAFQEAGYKSGYINKQISLPIESRVIKQCDYAYENIKPLDVDGVYDVGMIDDLKKCVSDTLQFFVMHMLGNHFRYEYRYPQEFEIYKPVMGKSFSYLSLTKENKEKLINAYDNCILYLDYFMDELISYVDSLNRSAVVLYMSDHGESFWEDERNLSLHGSYEISEYEFHVPMLVWYSDEYANKYPEKVENLQKNKTKAVSSQVLFYSLLDMANVKEVVDSTKSISSSYLQPIDSLWLFNGGGFKIHHSFKKSLQ
jgi:glucan phosphoethanolaminetransferase (alkaline phosphatase superfamily)